MANKKRLLRASLGGANIPAWVPRRADGSAVLIFADYVNNRFWYSGRVYLTEDAFNAAAGLTISSGVRISAPVAIGPELIANGGFPTDIAGWVAQDANTTLSWQSPGRLRALRAAGTTGGVFAFQPITVSYPHTYRIQYDAANGSFARTVGFANNSFAQTSTFSPANVNSGAGAIQSVYGKGGDTGTVITQIFLRADNVGSGAFAEWDSVSLKEVVPLAGWGDGTSFSGFVTGTAGSADPTGNEVIFQTDTNTENDRMRIVRDATKTLRLITTRASTQQANLSLSTLNNGADFSIAFTVAHGDVRAARDGGSQVIGAGSFPGTAILRAGGAVPVTNENWPATGAIKSWCIQ